MPGQKQTTQLLTPSRAAHSTSTSPRMQPPYITQPHIPRTCPAALPTARALLHCRVPRSAPPQRCSRRRRSTRTERRSARRQLRHTRYRRTERTGRRVRGIEQAHQAWSARGPGGRRLGVQPAVEEGGVGGEREEGGLERGTRGPV